MHSEVLNSRVKGDSVKSVVKCESEQFNYESASDDSIDLNSIVLKLADVENYNVDERIFSIEDSKFTTITLRCNNEYDSDGNKIGAPLVHSNLNENVNFIGRIDQSEVQNDISLKQMQQDGEKHDNAAFATKQITHVNKMVAVTMDNECVRNLENVNVPARRDYSTNDCTMMNIVNRNIKKNIVSVGVSTNDGNANEYAGNTHSEDATGNSSPSEDSSGSPSVTETSVNSLLNRLQYGSKDDTESSETDSSTRSSDEDMTSLDSGIRTVIYESAGSKDFDSTKNELNPELKRIDNVKATTKSSCVLS